MTTNSESAATTEGETMDALESLVAACEAAYVGVGMDDFSDDEDVTSPPSGITFGMIRRARASLIEIDQHRDALDGLRSAWNAHMATCPQHAALPEIAPPSQSDLDAWRDAPSGTASA